MAQATTPKVLDGVRVLELARWQAAPRGGMVLRDMGAEVIKIEWRKGADLRNSGPFVDDMSVQFAAYNRGKKSITLNTRHPKGKQMFMDLVEVSDVVLENFRPGTMDEMGFSYENLSKVNPGIILASVSGFGQYGPYRNRQCFDPIIQAMSGIGHQTGRGFDQPIMAEGPIMDRTAALHATIGILGALRYRDRTGEGQWLEVAMMDGGITYEEVALAMCHETGTNDFKRTGTFLKCKDGWVTTGAARAGMWERMLRVMGYDELADDPEFSAPMFATAQVETRMELLHEWCEERTVDEVEDLLVAADIPVGRANSIPEVLADRQIWEREVMMEMEIAEPGGKKMLVPGPTIIKFSKTPTTAGPIPKFGEHNQEIFAGLLGLDDGAMAGLREDGVIGE
ncbi:MAG: CoA transferase [Chloroflexi bacterium]|nr:CoA transferase [Chloroflexota bacterium]MDA1218633.1 CoA transferase [Chloroflexota bacterium]